MEIPDELLIALSKNKKAKQGFQNFSPSNQREYIAWVSDAKTEPTKIKRIATTVEWSAEGKSRNWKYERK